MMLVTAMMPVIAQVCPMMPIIADIAGQEDGAGAGDGLAPCLREQRGGRLLAVLAGTGHTSGDQPGHDGS